ASSNTQLTHPKAILVATNLSDLHRLMPFALQMAIETDARLQLLHVLPMTVELAPNVAWMPYYDREGAFSDAKNMLEPWCEHARKLGLQCTVLVRKSQPIAREIIQLVHQIHPDRLIIGTRSLGKLGRLLLGSVAEQVLCSVDLPVFTVGPEAHLVRESIGRQSTVLFATTLGEGHQANAALACQLAVSHKARLTILHVLSASSQKDGGADALFLTIVDELHQLAHKIEVDSCTTVDIKVAHGNPAVEILEEASASHARLIVMGSNDYSVFDHIARDRTICKVLAHARCPVLTLHGSTAPRSENKSALVAST
ncbi:MAG TPA: universal stress protein, partial [Candidatus Angelobacter sp.]|nr:universal stress protein [Candidatus Angelobacter sp.]